MQVIREGTELPEGKERGGGEKDFQKIQAAMRHESPVCAAESWGFAPRKMR